MTDKIAISYIIHIHIIHFTVDAYRDHIEAAADDAATQCVLTFHGIDTLATIWLNGVELRPAPRNMFVRYRYDVCGVLEKVNGFFLVVVKEHVLTFILYILNDTFRHNCNHFECKYSFLM